VPQVELAFRWQRFATWLVAGEVPPTYYALLRIGLAATLLVRQSDWLAPWFSLAHHRWVTGLDFATGLGLEPRLESPLGIGVALCPEWTTLLVYLRTVLAVLLLLGIRARATAFALAFVSFVLLGADRYRYFHHLYLLYLALACSSLAPLGTRFSVEAWFRRFWRRSNEHAALSASTSLAPAWPLQVIRALTLSVYASAGMGKLSAGWLSGDILALLTSMGLLTGFVWGWLVKTLGLVALAIGACATELALPVLLAVRRTRFFGLGVAVGFHTLIGGSMWVSSFGIEMLLLLGAFAVKRKERLEFRREPANSTR
jgi:hypothetical protein